MHQKTVLDNGLRIITSRVLNSPSVSLCFFLGAGSRYESDEIAGVSHFVEHLCFKGTAQRPSARAISEAIEGVGGLLNGGTDKEITLYWSKVARPHFPIAVEVLSDMLLHSLFDPQEIEKERRVILQEMDMIYDSPSSRVESLIDEVIWPRQPLGREVAGTKESVSSISRQNLQDYTQKQYLPGNTVVSVAGDIPHEEIVAKLEKAFGSSCPGTPQPWYPANDGQEKARVRVETKEIEQAHLSLALRGLSLNHPQRFALDLLNSVFGEGMSSRLFQEVRERRGLAYDIHSYVDHYLDSGSLGIYAGVPPASVDAAIGAILEELARLKEPIPEPELNRAKEFSKGRLLLRMEDTRSIAGWQGAQELLTGNIRTVKEVLNIVDALTAEDLQKVANQLLVSEKLNLAVVGPIKNGERLGSLLRI